MNTEFITRKVTDDFTVDIMPSPEFEFLMATKEVAKAYGISPDTLRSHKYQNQDDLIEGKHFISNVQILHGAGNFGSSRGTMWTKRGIIRLGFYIKSERAKLFRDWVEDLVLVTLEKKLLQLPEAPKLKHNRLTAERLLSIMEDVCMIEDKELRLRLAGKLKGAN